MKVEIEESELEKLIQKTKQFDILIDKVVSDMWLDLDAGIENPNSDLTTIGQIVLSELGLY